VGDVLVSRNRGQVEAFPLPIMLTMTLLIAVVVGAQVAGVMSDRDALCEAAIGAEGATYINDSDETFDCRASNGTAVENVTIKVQSNHGTTTVDPAEWSGDKGGDDAE
jgi:uncharacterized protein (UPF0333 family)